MQKLIPTLKQSLKVSLGIQQTINMLQLGSQDIEQLINNEMESNPFLIDEKAEIFSHDQLSLDEYSGSHSNFNNIKYSYNLEGEDPLYNLPEETSLKDYILCQIFTEIHENKERLIAYYLTDSLLDSGYIEIDFQELSKKLKCSKALLKKILTKLQRLEPTGVFARTLAECLKIQLIERKSYNNYYKILLQNLDKVALKDFPFLAKACKLPEMEIKNMIAYIKSLNPKPGSSFGSNKVSVRIADILVKANKNGELYIELNKENTPKIKVQKDYYAKLKSVVKQTEQKKFLSEKYYAANSLIISLEQRNNAIIKVATSIVNQQRSFFEKGILYLKPLTLQDVAIDTGLSESTVSRVTSNKLISTHYGLFEMKYFFMRSLPSSSASEEISTTKVKAIIKKLIDLESKDSIISDEEMSKQLTKFNIKVARRTIAKYREQLKIPSASTRKRDKTDA